MYAAYLVLRSAVEERSRRARLSAVYSVVAFVAVPLNFIAIRWWRAMHPLVLKSSGIGLTPTMLATLLVSVGAFTLLYATLLQQRLRLAVTEDLLHDMRNR